MSDPAPAEDDLDALFVLPRYIGPRHAILLCYIGYKTLHDLAKVPETHISTLPGLGEKSKRLQNLRHAMQDHGLAFLKIPKQDLMPRIRQTMKELMAEIDANDRPRGKPPHQAFQEALAKEPVRRSGADLLHDGRRTKGRKRDLQ